MKISVGNSRTDKHWNLKEVSVDEFSKMLSQTKRTAETVAQFKKLSKAQQDNIKDVGGFVAGELRNGIRKKDMVISRSAITLDADYATLDLPDMIEMFFNYRCIIYSTHKHTAENPRYRVIIPLLRDVTPDEYIAVARKIAEEIGMEYFDDTTYEPSRLMYWASTSADGEFYFKDIEGELLNPNVVLSKYTDWHNVAELPVSNRQQTIVQREIKRQADPLEKKGIVGAFCRAYTVSEAIDKFIPDTYKPSYMQGRYDYIPADSSAGVVIYDDKFAYSHHATDPACGRLMNAFDVVRFHRFGELDAKTDEDTESTKLPSYKAMQEFSLKDDNVKIQLAETRMAEAQKEFDTDWRTQLKYMSKSGVLENSVWNEILILNNDTDFANFAFNEMANRVQITGEVPWERPRDNKFWRDADTAQLKALIDVRYTTFSSRNHDVAFTKVADDRHFHPVRDYLDSLQEWDGKKRVESLLIECLQAEDTPYVRAVTRKTFAAAVARIYKPGTKFDSVLVFDGVQGIGKSTFFKELVGEEYYSETLSLTDMNDKSGSEKLQGFWIMEIAELAGMKKADIEKVKAFLSTSDDKYRPSYGKTVESHPRQCVIIASVNGERGYLRDITGNRRFWVVKLNQTEQVKRWNFTKYERDQIWAEAKTIYESGEKLYLEGDLIKAAEEVQRDAMEVDERQGMVEEYLERLLPEDWNTMDIYNRRSYISERNNPMAKKGVVKRMTVSNAEIWCECFGRSIADLKPSDSYAIAAIMIKVTGWKRTNKVKQQPNYGKQRVYERA